MNKTSMRDSYGKYKGYYKWDLAIEWFQMSNYMFFDKYKFNFNPHEYGNLYLDCRRYLFK